MNRRPQIILVSVFAAVFAFIGLQAAIPLLPVWPVLKGITAETEPIDWSWAAFRSGALGKGIEKWFEKRIGQRNLLIAIDDQVSYTFFGETVPRPQGTRIISGAHDWLFELQYVRTALSQGEMTDAVLKSKAARIKSVQEKLGRRGIPLIFVIAPSKAEIYPEHVPEAYFAGRRMEDASTDFEHMRPILESAGVDFYDGPARYAAWKAAGQRNLFARSGTHWSYISAVQVLREIRERFNPMMRHKIPELVIGSTPVGKPRINDTDLLDLANLLVASPYAHDIPYPELVAQKAVPEADLPRILWVHDSFGWVLIDLMYSANAVRPSESLYYGLGDLQKKKLRSIPGARELDEPVVAEIDWESFLRNYDAVVIVGTEIAGVYLFDGWSLLERLDKDLK